MQISLINSRFTNYIGRITEYAIKTVKQQIPATGTVPSFQGDKVGQWLMNGHVEDWNRVGAPFVISIYSI